MSPAKKRYLVCLSNEGYEGALDRNAIYLALGDASAEEPGFVRVVDASGQDYLYGTERFAEIESHTTTWRGR